MSRHTARRWAPFAAWAVVGALAALGVVSLLTIGIALLVAAAVLAGLLLWRRADGVPVAGLGLGAAAVAAYLAWLDRGGPGTVCQAEDRTTVRCTDEWAPWPFVAVAVVLATASVVIFLWAGRGRPARPAAGPPAPP